MNVFCRFARPSEGLQSRASLRTCNRIPGTPRHSTTPDSWAVAERHRANICSDVAWVVYESHESHVSNLGRRHPLFRSRLTRANSWWPAASTSVLVVQTFNSQSMVTASTLPCVYERSPQVTVTRCRSRLRAQVRCAAAVHRGWRRSWALAYEHRARRAQRTWTARPHSARSAGRRPPRPHDDTHVCDACPAHRVPSSHPASQNTHKLGASPRLRSTQVHVSAVVACVQQLLLERHGGGVPR
jgi:hypothetical protein